MKINGFISTVMLIGLLLITSLGDITHAQDKEDWMPDPNLQQAIREELAVPDTIPIHPGDMARLQNLLLIKIEPDIRSLKGLEHAVNLKVLVIDRSEVSDLTPLAGLENLESLSIIKSQVSDLTPLVGLENLRVLKLYENRISDITPFAGLINLEVLVLGRNQIADISPLAGLVGLQVLELNANLLTDISPLQGLVNLKELQLEANQIEDISSLTGLVNLKGLALESNQIADISPLQGLVNLKELHLSRNKIIDFTPIYGLAGIEVLTLGRISLDSEVLQILKTHRLVTCDIERAPILPRIENRAHPSVFQACGDIVNLPKLSREEGIAYHDLFFCAVSFGWAWNSTPDGWKLTGNLEDSMQIIDRMRAQNPNLILLTGIHYYAASRLEYPEDLPYWLRDESGNILEIPTWDEYIIDFTRPAAQEWIIQQAIEVAKCGIFDGIAIDHWAKALEGYITVEEANTAKDRIIQGIRDAVGEDFLILVTTTNTIGTTIPRHAEYINGVFMETYEDYEGGYTYARLSEIESTLSWAEENLREPQINCLAGRGVRNELLDSSRNLQWMRLWTTMSLTHSDGYVMFTMGGALDHPAHPFEFWPGHTDLHAQGKRHTHQNTKYWYDFYDAPLGQPVGGDETKAQLYENREGLFIREFTNGWAVYNRSGAPQVIRLIEQATGVESSLRNTLHILPDLDGEIYLKSESGLETPPTTDVNADGIVNILDLVAVANAFGKDTPDVNGDGTVNVLDLVAVANAFE